MTLLVEDRDLLDRFRAGEAKALARVFAHYAESVAAVLRRGFSFRAGEQPIRFQGYAGVFDLEDAIQEIFRRAFSEHARSTYDGLRPYRAYLSTIVRNTVINDYLARSRVLERYSIDDMAPVPTDPDWSAADDVLGDEAPEPRGEPERDAETQELHRLVQVFKATLSGREREVFALRFARGLSQAQIEAESGLSASKIKTAEAHLRKSFLRFMRGHGYLENRSTRTIADSSAKTVPQGDES